LVIVFYILTNSLIYGQVNIKGTVIDKHTKQAILNVHIYDEAGGKAVITDSLGYYQIDVAELPAFLSFSHISYHPKAKLVQFIPDNGLKIELTSKDFKINEVVVMADRVQEFLKKESFYVREMEFGDGFIWVIGYPDKNVMKPELRVLSLGGTSLGKSNLKKAGSLFKDAFGDVHMVYDDYLYQLYWDGDSIQEIYPFAKDGSEEFLFNLQTSFDSLAIIRRSVGVGVYKEFVAFSFVDSSQRVIHQSFDHDLYASARRAKNHRYGSIPDIIFPAFGISFSFDPSDAFTRHVQDRLLTYTPINCKLFRLESELIIFEDKGPFLWKYGLDLALHEMLAIQLPDRSTKIELLQDPLTSQPYLLYEIKGLEYISKVDANTGALINTMQLDGFTFVDNVRIYGNRVYYLDQSRAGAAIMNLYSMSID